MKGRQIKYSEREMMWLERHRLMTISDYHAGFVSEFGRHDVAAGHLHALRKHRGWKTGRTGCFVKGQEPPNKGEPCPPGTGGRHPNARRTQFKRGNAPHNTNYLGHERVSKDGYVEISVDDVNPHTGYERRYVLKHRWLWEQAHGPVPDGMCLKCKGNRQDCDPSNWECVPRALLPRLDGRFGRGYETAPDEMRPTIMAVVKLEQSVREKRKTSKPHSPGHSQ